MPHKTRHSLNLAEDRTVCKDQTHYLVKMRIYEDLLTLSLLYCWSQRKFSGAKARWKHNEFISRKRKNSDTWSHKEIPPTLFLFFTVPLDRFQIRKNGRIIFKSVKKLINCLLRKVETTMSLCRLPANKRTLFKVLQLSCDRKFS